MRMLVVLAIVVVAALAPRSVLAEEAAGPVVLPTTHVQPRAPVHVFVARSRTERPLEALRATFTTEIVSSARRAPF